MSWKSRLRHRRNQGRAKPLLLLAGVAVLIGIPLLRDALESEEQASPTRWADGRMEIRTSFGRCHEGGGRNCVVDGDTVWIGREKVRIAGIDAPETHEPKCAKERALGLRSAERLQALLSSGMVTATRGDRDTDPNGRLLRNLAVNGRDVGRILVREGLARDYRGGKRGWC